MAGRGASGAPGSLGAESVLPDAPDTWLTSLHEAAQSVAAATTAQQALSAALAASKPCLGPTGGALLVLDASGEYLSMDAMEGLPETFSRPWEAIGLGEGLPVTDAVRTSEPVWLEAFGERFLRYPDALPELTDQPTDVATGSLPLLRAGSCVGVLAVVRSRDEPFSEVERVFLMCLADQLAVLVASLNGRLPQRPSTASWEESADAQATGTVELGYFSWNMRTGRVECDETTLRLHGLTPPAVRPVEDFIAQLESEDLPDVRNALERMGQLCGDYQVHYRIREPGGRIRVLEARGRVHPGADGIPERMSGVVTDVTVAEARREADQQTLRHQAEQADKLREFARLLSAAVTVQDIARTARTALQAFDADALLLAEQQEDRISVVASCGYSREKTEILRSLPLTIGSPIGDALRRHVPVFLDSLEALLAAYPRLESIAGQIVHRSWAALPLPSTAGPPAACLIGFPDSHAFSASQRSLLSVAAGLLAQSLDRARLYEAEHRLARELQRGLLPQALRGPASTEVHAHYRPATSGMLIGGDWYDAFPTPDGGLALVIGDVQGHSVVGATLMGQLRTAVRAYTNEGHDPAAVLERTNQLLTHLNPIPETALFATCCYAHLDPGTGDLAICRAGHPTPIVTEPGQEPRCLEVAGGTPLGVDAGATYPTTRVRLPVGAQLLLYTDGLIEDRGHDIDEGIACVLAALATPAPSPEECLGELIRTCAPAPGRLDADDVAALLVRYIGPDGG
ncbi:SpoIIE family protein phosphatase [Wenjunlia tyrosinilytica]|uniref:Uncharacterized protein n=1 Tax=Wenjunlia tyrosinilytica TaxID=1544741 RepID=A0A918E0U2_9ACTN|nr:SpoIIE family protein phosphatase [Wenjunlia tyrosinilytica]GGO94105.1 hypothetical protein GCM10012280_48170 [Wenjunlia tyrosinilytica]